MQREIVTHDDGSFRALALRATAKAPERASLETASAHPSMVRISLGGRPLLWARTWSDHYGWTWLPAAPSERVLGPIRASEAREIAARAAPGGDAWWSAWAFRFAGSLGALTSSARSPLVWLGPPSPFALPSLRIEELVPFEPRELYWDPHAPPPLPLRPWPAADDGRVSALRKLARDGSLPPIVMAWSSALQTHLVLDGHARLVASLLEGRTPSVLALTRLVARATVDSEASREKLRSAHATLTALAQTSLKSANMAAMDAARIEARLDAGRRPLEWDEVDRAVAMPVSQWRREVRAALGARRDPIARDLLRRGR